jgi:alpha-glucuronidase
MLADALAPHGGIVLWRAFVYDTTIDADRAKCGYKEFVPLDGKFQPNVFVQVKNGPIDFQPREPFHPLFGAMTQTPLALELQITQEYLGQSIHLVYLAGMWKEILDSETYAQGPGSAITRLVIARSGLRDEAIPDAELEIACFGFAQHRKMRSFAMTWAEQLPGSTVARVVDGSLYGHSISSIVGVANTGSDRNWCGHHFAQANWYAFGRLGWDCDLSADAIADEWIRMTWSNDSFVLDAIKAMMLGSWEACVNYMTPLGLHHIMQAGHHYGPDPAFNAAPRLDWNNVYFHRADTKGLGFDRSSKGSNAISQYHSPLREQFDNIDTCPEKFLLWFHHVPWGHRLQSGNITTQTVIASGAKQSPNRNAEIASSQSFDSASLRSGSLLAMTQDEQSLGNTLWEELQHRYDAGVGFVETMRGIWQGLQDRIDPQRHAHVSARLEQQLENACLWREVCVKYFGRFVTLER